MTTPAPSNTTRRTLPTTAAAMTSRGSRITPVAGLTTSTVDAGRIRCRWGPTGCVGGVFFEGVLIDDDVHERIRDGHVDEHGFDLASNPLGIDECTFEPSGVERADLLERGELDAYEQAYAGGATTSAGAARRWRPKRQMPNLAVRIASTEAGSPSRSTRACSWRP